MSKRVSRRATARATARAVLVAVGACATAGGGGAARGASISWTKTTGGNFNNIANWNNGAGPIPGSGDFAQFNIANTYTVTLDISPTVAQTFVAGSTVTFANSTAGRTYTNTGTMFVNSGTFNLTAATPISWTNSNNTGFNATVNIGSGNHFAATNLTIGAASSSVTTVDGTGSSLSATGGVGLGQANGITGTLTFSNGASGTLNAADLATFSSGTGNLNVQSGASVSLGATNLATNAIAGTVANFTVTGTGSSLVQGGSALAVGASFASQATLTVSSSATATLNAGVNVFSTGELDVLSGGTVSTTANVGLFGGTGTRGSLIVGGTGSAFTQSGAFSFLTVGSSSGSTSTLQVNTGGTYSTAAAAATVNATGVIDIAGGTFNANGPLTVNAGVLQRSSGASLNISSGKTMTVQGGGQANLTGNYTLNSGGSIKVTGAGSSFAQLGSGIFGVGGGSAVTLESGGSVSAVQEQLGTSGTGTFTQTGGTHTISGALNPFQVGAASGATGNYNLSGGTLTVVNNDLGNNGEAVGFNGAGNFTQTGGDHTVSGTNGNLAIGYAATGVGNYTISNGNLTANSIYIGRNAGAQGTLTLNTGAFVTAAAEFLDLGLLPAAGTTPAASGTVNANGGFLSAKGIFVGGNSTAAQGIGVLTINGGNVSAAVFTGLTNSGQVRVWNTAGSAINLMAGSLSADALLTSGNPSRFNWTGGNLYITGAGGFEVSSSGPLGASLTLDNGRQLQVTKRLTIAAGSSLAVTGASALGVGSLTGAGSLSSDFSYMFIGSDNTSSTFGGTISGAGGISKVGTGKLTVGQLGIGPVAIHGGSIALVSGGGVSSLASLTTDAGTNLDLANDKLVVTTAGSAGSLSGTTYTGVTGLVQAGRNGGSWNGTGIITSAAAPNSDYTTLGVATAADALGISPGVDGTWNGRTVHGSNTLVMYTYGGDANLDGLVNIDDYTIIDSNIGIQGPPLGNGSPALSAVAAVPEPAATVFMAVGAAWAAGAARRRRSRRPTNRC